MIKQPDFVTERLKLIPISHRHAALLWPILSHPMVREYNDIPDFVDKIDFRDYLQTDIELWLEGIGGRWILDYQGIVIGSCGLYPLNDQGTQLQLSFELSPDYWHQGFMFEACTQLLAFDFSVLNISDKAVYARCHTHNDPSIKLLKKLGFKYVSQTKNYVVYKR